MGFEMEKRGDLMLTSDIDPFDDPHVKKVLFEYHKEAEE